MKWYEQDTQRFEKEVNQLTAQGLNVSITNAGCGDVYAVLDSSSERGIDLLIHFPDDYPKEPPRYYLPNIGNLPALADGAIDLKALGIEWNEALSALEPLQSITKYDATLLTKDNDIKANRLILKNLTNYLSKCGEQGFEGRERELMQLMESLTRKENAGAVLIGKPGVGKTALAYRFIQNAAIRDVPPVLKSMIFYELRLENILASSRYIGDAERAVKKLLDFPGTIALFIDEIHRLSSPQLSQVADAIKPEMASGKLRIIGASTYDEWRQVQDGALKRRLVIIDVPEPTMEETYLMIKQKVSQLRHYYGMDFSDDVIKTAIGLGKIYLSESAFPAKAIDILDRAAASQTVRKFNKEGRHIKGKELSC